MTDTFNASTVIGTIDRADWDMQIHSVFGHILSNDYSYASFGGSLDDTESVDESQYPVEDRAVMFYVHQQDPVVLAKSETFSLIQMGNNVTRNVMEGAYASAPSENLGWVFGGSKVGPV